MSDPVEEVLKEAFLGQKLISATLSAPLSTHECQSIKIRPLTIQSGFYYQWTEQRADKAHHSNLTPEECYDRLQSLLMQFKQTMLHLENGDFQVLVNKKGRRTLLKKAATKQKKAVSHNRAKHYLLAEGAAIAFLAPLGIANSEGRVYPHQRDKFRQINRFVEIVDDVLEKIEEIEPLHIVDFGCGKAYLTFALYHYLKVIRGLEVTITGIDVKEDLVKQCQRLAGELGFAGLSFHRSNITDYQTMNAVEMVVSLHACDTATDDALKKAVEWNAKVILCAPCCQHELRGQIRNPQLQPILKHGIMKERFAALATDAARAQLLEVLGYQVQVLEFVDVEHTPKNLLIRAVRKPEARWNAEAWKIYEQFKEHLEIHPSFESCCSYLRKKK